MALSEAEVTLLIGPYGGCQMVPHVTTILQRFTTEWAALLQPEAILTACGEVGYIAWRH